MTPAAPQTLISGGIAQVVDHIDLPAVAADLAEGVVFPDPLPQLLLAEVHGRRAADGSDCRAAGSRGFSSNGGKTQVRLPVFRLMPSSLFASGLRERSP